MHGPPQGGLEPGPGRPADYFWKNREHGITSRQDTEIEVRLRALGVTP
ncbi:MAG: hypothetical protein OXI46_05990 [Gemmatimonadota bacterium]|nr:hypothetical protein [Gemmatimonadota bacterium]